MTEHDGSQEKKGNPSEGIDDIHTAPYAEIAERILRGETLGDEQERSPLSSILANEKLPVSSEGFTEEQVEQQLERMLGQFQEKHLKSIKEKNGIDLSVCQVHYDDEKQSYVIRDQDDKPITKLDMSQIAFNEPKLYLPPCLLDLVELDFSANSIDEVDDLPLNIQDLTTGARRVLNLPPNLKKLKFRGDTLPDSLPETLEVFDCQMSFLDELPMLPDSLIVLNCADIIDLMHIADTLPPKLETLICWGSYLTSLPNFPDTLTTLICSRNHLTSLPDFPPNLQILRCASNQLTDLPRLPRSVKAIEWDKNPMDEKTIERIWEELKSL